MIHIGGQLGDGWQAVHKAFGVMVVRSVEHLLTLPEDTLSAVKLHVRRRESFDAAVPMLVVAPRKKYLAVPSRVVEASVKAVRKTRPEVKRAAASRHAHEQQPQKAIFLLVYPPRTLLAQAGWIKTLAPWSVSSSYLESMEALARQ